MVDDPEREKRERQRAQVERARQASGSVVGSGPGQWPPPDESTGIAAQRCDSAPVRAARAEPLSRREEIWIEKYLARQHWSLPEALAWVAFRSGRTAAEVLDFGASTLYRDPPSLIDAVLNLTARDLGAAEREPLDALHLALIRNQVHAYQTFQAYNDPPSLDEIAADLWQHLEFRHDDGVSFAQDVRRNPWVRGGKVFGIQFDRASVIRAFPETSEPDAELRESPQAVVAGVEPWRLRPGETQKSYALRPEVVEEAKRTQTRDSEAALCEAIARLSEKFKAASVASTRRTNRAN